MVPVLAKNAVRIKCNFQNAGMTGNYECAYALGILNAQLGLPEITEYEDIAEMCIRDRANAMWDRIPMVRIDGKLYYDTGRESIMDARCGTMDGEITSTVDGTEIPTEDNQSNFGSGFGYQYGADDTIEIYMNEKWFVFEYREESE